MSYIGKNPPFITIPADDAVTTAMLQDDSVTSAKIDDGTIDTIDIADDAVTADKLANAINTSIAANTSKVTNATHTGDVTGATALTIANDAVDIAMLSATGTASATTFLRGDNAWSAAGIVKAWINFDGTGTIAISDSFNVTSITDKGTGNYTITWDTDFANADYAVAGMSLCTQCFVALQAKVAGSIDIYTGYTTDGNQYDNANVCIIAIGDQ